MEEPIWWCCECTYTYTGLTSTAGISEVLYLGELPYQSHIAVQDAMIIGADYYESEDQRSALLAAGRIPIGIGRGSVISNTIVDKNARIGQNCQIVNKEGVEEAVREDEGLYIRSGIVCVLRNAEIPNGTQV